MKNYFLILLLNARETNAETYKCGNAEKSQSYSYVEPELLRTNGRREGEKVKDGFSFYYPVASSGRYASAHSMSVTTLRDPFQCQLEEATPNSFPWQVAIIKDTAIKCSGTLIHPSWILTSGSCHMRKMKVIAGFHSIKTVRNDLQKGNAQERIPISKMLLRPHNYNRDETGKFRHNLLLIKLETPFNLSSTVSPICLPESTDFLLSEGTRCVTTGWGIINKRANLMQQITEVRPIRDCEALYQKGTTKDRICISMGCTCLENGMPLAAIVGEKDNSHFVLAGVKLADGRIVSRRKHHSDNCGHVPRLYLPIAPYLNWIKDTVWPELKTTQPSPTPPPIRNLNDLSDFQAGFINSRAPFSTYLGEDDETLINTIIEIERQKHRDPIGCLQKNYSKSIGREYRGGADTTRFGFPCIPWSATIHFTSDMYPLKGLNSNYCRNPDDDQKGPWCFFHAPQKRTIEFGYCNIPMCP